MIRKLNSFRSCRITMSLNGILNPVRRSPTCSRKDMQSPMLQTVSAAHGSKSISLYPTMRLTLRSVATAMILQRWWKGLRHVLAEETIFRCVSWIMSLSPIRSLRQSTRLNPRLKCMIAVIPLLRSLFLLQRRQVSLSTMSNIASFLLLPASTA